MKTRSLNILTKITQTKRGGYANADRADKGGRGGGIGGNADNGTKAFPRKAYNYFRLNKTEALVLTLFVL